MENTVRSSTQDDGKGIATCQRILRLATVVILSAFVLVIVLTTFSTGVLVQQMGKSLYFVIVGSALVSLATWFFRTRLEKRTRRAGLDGESG